MSSIKLTDKEKEIIYEDLMPGESIKSLCRRHNISSHMMYGWINKIKSPKSPIPLKPLQVIGAEEGYFAKIILGTKEIWIGQSVPASYINELK